MVLDLDRDGTDEFVLVFNGRILASGHVQEIRALMNEFPHRITIRCDDGKQLAHRIMRDLPVQGVELQSGGGELAVLTHEPAGFYEGLGGVVLDSGVRVSEVISADDNLEAVFHYLMQVDG